MHQTASHTLAKEPGGTVALRLYVAGDAPNSRQAVSNLHELCREHPAWSAEIIDVFEDPLRALEDGVVVTPTLIKLAPPPVGKLVGTLSRRDVVLATLELGVLP